VGGAGVNDGTAIALEPAQDADAPALAEGRVAAMRESLERLGRFDPERARARFLQGFAASETWHVVAGGRRVGVLVLRRGEGELRLDHLYIWPGHQGQGHGAAVLRQVAAQADRARLPVRLTALKGSRSNDFYRRHGYRPDGESEWDLHYRRPASARLSPRARRVLQAVLYEAIAVAAVGPALGWLFDVSMGSALALSVLMSTVALAWNFLFNGWFERWEARHPVGGRPWHRRLLHGLGFEGGLVLMLVPVMAWWLETTWWQAFLADLGVLAFFFVYAIGFTWAFDRVFGLPDSAGGAEAAR
jgi:uncharacterized membrane protein/predicted GNAT family acetyltransferase